MDIQKFINDANKAWRNERANSQLTLGKLMEILKSFPSDKKVEKLFEPMSYRGYYDDIALKHSAEEQTVAELIDLLGNSCLYKEFCGYKGGDFFMDDNTPVWIADYGCTGLKIVGIIEDGNVLRFETKEDNY